MQNSELSRLPAAENEPTAPEGSLRDAELVAALPAVAFLPALLLLGVLGAAFLWQGGRGREAEFLGAGAAVLVAFLVPWRLATLGMLGALAAVVVIENRHHRLDAGRVWELVLYGIAIFSASLCAAHLRRAASRQRAELRRVLAQARTDTLDRSFESLLTGPSRLGSLNYELDRSRRHSREFGLLIVQPDDVEAGALESDREKTMSAMAETIGAELRATDVAFLRDEHSYCVILPETGTEGARVAAERIRLSVVAKSSAATGEVSASVGVAVFPDDASSNDALVDAATRALARAVELGGNRTVLARVPDEAPAGWGLAESPQVAR